MPKIHAGTILALLVFLGMGCTSQTQPPAAGDDALYWLEKADEAASRIADATPDGVSLKTTALTTIAFACLDVGEIEKAKQIAARLPEADRRTILYAIPVSLVCEGNYDAAVREADVINEPGCWQLVAIFCARKNIPLGLKLVEKIVPAERSLAYAEVVRQQVLAGDLEGAGSTASRVTDEELKKSADLWVAAGRLVDGTAELREAAADAKVPLGDIQSELLEILQARASAGDLHKARRVLRVFDDPDRRSAGHTAIAEHQLKKGDTAGFAESIEAALKESAAIQDSVTAPLVRAVRYTGIARLQAKAGDLEGAARTIRLAGHSAKEEAIPGRGLGVFEALGGNVVLVGLLISADRIEEAAMVATGKDGAIVPEALPLLAEAYAAKGQTQKLDDVLKSAQSPEAEYQLYLHAAKGSKERLKSKSVDP